jgi:hypothetical protein
VIRYSPSCLLNAAGMADSNARTTALRDIAAEVGCRILEAAVTPAG